MQTAEKLLTVVASKTSGTPSGESTEQVTVVNLGLKFNA